MDFFESQDVARRKTKLLLFLFVLAVVSLVVLTNLLIFVFINFQDTATVTTGAYHYSWETFAVISLGVIGLVLLASLFRWNSLRGGGRAVAEMMDGVLLVDAGGDLNRKKLLNIVEEMALASGTPVPPVYLINDQAINAFAAGYSPGDAVIGVTTGAIENLNREELQGVIAHEFSHILNGDMRLNIRLIGALYGILMIALIGRILLQSGSHRSTSRDRSQGSLAMLGLGLMAVGYLGKFFGNLIKAAVSRQREYLADASSVQFTRNPQGIADALKRIGGYSAGSVLAHPESEELSHAFFSEGIAFSLSGMMSTHPPLADRIKRIEPRWDGEFLESTTPEPAAASSNEAVMGFASNAAPVSAAPIDADEVIAQVGNAGDTQIQMARQIISALPEAFVSASRDPYSARALVYFMMLNDEVEVRQAQLAHLEEAADMGVFDAVQKLAEEAQQFAPIMRLPLLEMALPTLHQLSYEQYKLFLGNLDALIKADGRIGLSEWAVRKMIRKHLGEVFERTHSKVRYHKLAEVREHCEVLLSMLAYSDRQSTIAPQQAFDTGAASIDIELKLLEKKQLGFKTLNAALDNLAQLHPLRKPKLLKACIRTVTADEVISTVEQELLRTIADTLECPMPPLSIQ